MKQYLLSILTFASFFSYSQKINLANETQVSLKTNVLQIPNTNVHWNLVYESKLTDKYQSNNFSLAYTVKNYGNSSKRERFYIAYERRFYVNNDMPRIFIAPYLKLLYRKVNQNSNAQNIYDFLASNNKRFTSFSTPVGLTFGIKHSNNKKLTFELPISCGMGYLFFSNLKSGYSPTKAHLDGQILFQMILKI